MIKAITFDLWDTVIHDDSDEPKRRAQGLASKRDARRDLVWEALNQHSAVDKETVSRAYDVTEAAFSHVWHQQYVTWTVQERIRVLLNGLGRSLPASDFDAVVRAHEDMEVDVCPDPVEGICETVAELATRYPLAVVSDAIVSPGRCLKKILGRFGILQHFSGFAFSDEVGYSKPHRNMFGSAAQQLGVEISSLVHIGDRDHNDVKGPHALGMKAVLFAVTRDADKAHTSADAICEKAADLPAIIDALASR
jgi:FMN phosphatase YigB (HAD superfamily)